MGSVGGPKDVGVIAAKVLSDGEPRARGKSDVVFG